MNKFLITILVIMITVSGVIAAVILYKPEEKQEVQENIIAKTEKVNTISNNIVKNESNTENMLTETNSHEEKVSPNAFVTFKTEYKGCDHTTTTYMEVPKEFVNNTKAELQEKYSEWKIEEFTDTEIVLSKEEEGSCGEHYIARETDGFVTIYQKLDDGTEKEYEKTDISTEYLTKQDKENISKGIIINGKQDLNQFIEDFE